MADNFTVLDSVGGTITIRATDLAGVHIPWHRSTGPTAHDAAAAENPVLAAGYASAAAPAAVSADGDVVRLWALRNGALVTVLTTAAGALIGGDAPNGLDVDVTRLPAIPAGANLIGSVTALGAAAHDAAVSGNPVLNGAFASAAAPAAVSADGDVVRLWALRNGALAVNLTAAGALIAGDAGNGLDVDPTREAPNPSTTSATFSEGTKTVAATGTPERLAAATTRVQSVEIQAAKGQNSANATDVFIGFTITNATQMRRLQAWETLVLEAPPGKKIDLNLIIIDVLTNGDGVTFLAMD